MGQEGKDDPRDRGTYRKLPELRAVLGEGNRGVCCGMCCHSQSSKPNDSGGGAQWEDTLATEYVKAKGWDPGVWKAADYQVEFPDWQGSRRAFIVIAAPGPFLRVISLSLCFFFSLSLFLLGTNRTEQT